MLEPPYMFKKAKENMTSMWRKMQDVKKIWMNHWKKNSNMWNENYTVWN